MIGISVTAAEHVPAADISEADFTGFQGKPGTSNMKFVTALLPFAQLMVQM